MSEYTVKSQWQAAASAYTFVDFVGHPFGTILSDQYADVGLHFTDGNDQIDSTPSYITDNWGITGHPSFDGDTIGMAFTTPQYWIAVDYPGVVKFQLFNQGELVYTSSGFFVTTPSGLGGFAGLVSTTPFDAVILSDWIDNHVFIDNLYFGGPVPASGGLLLLAFGGIGSSRKRRA